MYEYEVTSNLLFEPYSNFNDDAIHSVANDTCISGWNMIGGEPLDLYLCWARAEARLIAIS